MRIVGIMLAAGEGRRFGGDKLLAALPDGTAVGVQSLRNMLAVLPEVVAVTRPEDEALQASLAAEGARVEICPRAAEGMGASLAHGVRAAADADGWIVALGDMPKIRPATIRTLSEALIGGALIAAPIYAGSRGHPVAFAAALGPRLAGLSGDAGAREILRAEWARVVLLASDDPGIVADIDTSADLQRIGRE